MIFTECPLGADQDVIFGLLWFRDYAPQVDWSPAKILHQKAHANSDGMNDNKLAQPDHCTQSLKEVDLRDHCMCEETNTPRFTW